MWGELLYYAITVLNYVQLLILTIKKTPAPTFSLRLIFWGVLWGWLCTQESFRGGKRFHLTLHGNVMRNSRSKSYHDFCQCSLCHRTTVKALGSLGSGFSLPLGLNSKLGEDSPALEPSSPQNQHLPLLGVGCWARGVLPPRHFAGQLNNFPLVALDCYFSSLLD